MDRVAFCVLDGRQRCEKLYYMPSQFAYKMTSEADRIANPGADPRLQPEFNPTVKALFLDFRSLLSASASGPELALFRRWAFPLFWIETRNLMSVAAAPFLGQPDDTELEVAFENPFWHVFGAAWMRVAKRLACFVLNGVPVLSRDQLPQLLQPSDEFEAFVQEALFVPGHPQAHGPSRLLQQAEFAAALARVTRNLLGPWVQASREPFPPELDIREAVQSSTRFSAGELDLATRGFTLLLKYGKRNPLQMLTGVFRPDSVEVFPDLEPEESSWASVNHVLNSLGPHLDRLMPDLLAWLKDVRICPVADSACCTPKPEEKMAFEVYDPFPLPPPTPLFAPVPSIPSLPITFPPQVPALPTFSQAPVSPPPMVPAPFSQRPLPPITFPAQPPVSLSPPLAPPALPALPVLPPLFSSSAPLPPFNPPAQRPPPVQFPPLPPLPPLPAALPPQLEKSTWQWLKDKLFSDPRLKFKVLDSVSHAGGLKLHMFQWRAGPDLAQLWRSLGHDPNNISRNSFVSVSADEVEALDPEGVDYAGPERVRLVVWARLPEATRETLLRLNHGRLPSPSPV